jgi:hypothetical protein
VSVDAETFDHWTLPWPEIRVPDYRPGAVGAWRIERRFHSVLRGYFRGLQHAGANWLLTRSDRV